GPPQVGGTGRPAAEQAARPAGAERPELAAQAAQAAGAVPVTEPATSESPPTRSPSATSPPSTASWVRIPCACPCPGGRGERSAPTPEAHSWGVIALSTRTTTLPTASKICRV